MPDPMTEEVVVAVINSTINSTTNATGGVPQAGRPAPPRPMMPPGLPTWLIIAVMATVCALALVGNTLVIFCFVKFRKKFKQNTVAYLISLALSDLWIGFMTGVGIFSVVYERWVFGGFLCQTFAFANNVALINSLWTVALGSVDRCLAIRMPFKYRSIITRKRLMFMLLGTWFYAVCLSLPPLLRVSDLRFTFHRSHPWCAMSSRYNRFYFLAFSLGFLPLPILIILSSYTVIFLTTKHYTKRQLNRISGGHDRRSSVPLIEPSRFDGPAEHTSDGTLTSLLSSPANDTKPRVEEDDSGRVLSASFNTLKSNGWTAHSPSDKPRGCFYLLDKIKGLFKHKTFNSETVSSNARENTKLTTSFIFHTGNVTNSRHQKDSCHGNEHFSSNTKTEEEAAARKLQNQAATLLGVIGATILLSYTPILGVSTLASFNYRVTVSFKAMQAFTLLMLSNASINPLIYFLLNKEFRQAAKSLFRQICFPVPSRNSYQGSGGECARVRGNTISTSHLPSVTLSESAVWPNSRPNSSSSLLKQENVSITCKGDGGNDAAQKAVAPVEPTLAHKIGSTPATEAPKSVTNDDKTQRHILRNSLALNEPVLTCLTPTSTTPQTKTEFNGPSFFESESAI